MAKRKPATPKQAALASRQMDAWLERMAARHEANLVSAIKTMEKRTRALMWDLDTSRGRLVSTRSNLSQAQAVHSQLNVILEATVLKFVDKKLAKDLDRAVKRSSQYLTRLTGRPQRFAGIDRTWVNRLKKVNLAEFHNLGTVAVDDVAKAMYEHLMGGSRFTQLQKSVSNVLVGRKDMVGRPMTVHAKRMAFDTVRTHTNEVTMYKAEKIGLKTFIYYGDVIKDSRPFCVRNAGQIMGGKRIAELDKQRWRGKSGPFKTHRGGYNCRHFFVPGQEEWFEDGETSIEVQNAFEE